MDSSTKTKFIIGFILILLVILQSTVLDYIKIFNVKPDLVLATVIIVGVSADLKWVMVFSYLAGFLKDILGTSPFGLNTLVFPLLGFLSFKLSKKIAIETEYMKAATVFMAVILENLIAFLWLIFTGLDISLGIFSRFTIISSIYTVLILILIFKIIRIPEIAPHP